jgi:hypothetical protein
VNIPAVAPAIVLINVLRCDIVSSELSIYLVVTSSQMLLRSYGATE